MKKLTRLFFVFIFIIACIALFASCGKVSKGLLYAKAGEGTCFVDGLGECKDTKIIIPEKNEKGETVTAIYMSMNSFMDCSHVTELILPETLRWFNYNYYTMTREMPNLKFNEYENGKYLGTKDNPYFALIKSEDTYSEDVTIHPDTKVIGYKAFDSKLKLKTAIIPEGIQYIGSGAFTSCSNLININIPSSVIAMSEGTFWGCTALESVTIPGTLKNVCSHMFVDCTALETVIIEEGIETIGYGAFSGCTALKNVILPKGVKTVSISAFDDCTSLTEIAFADGLETIGSNAFGRCSNLQKISIPSTVTYLGRNAFDECVKLKYNEYGNAKYLGNEENPYVALIQPLSTSVMRVTIAETTTAIKDAAFMNCSNIKEIEIPEGVVHIGQDVFYGCTNLTTLTMPSTLKRIYYWAFKDCSSLLYVTYNGTIEQWKAMPKEDRHAGWAEGTTFKIIRCSDGNLNIKEDYR
ncbi:MAG: leucine-rich repeat domain-containing protein [Ruminococcaceae bacterium]|nr:leucine-rich repeat domain-containing protein [Oscillospiraceae bacterium]